MKTQKSILAILITTSLFIASCSNDDEPTAPITPTPPTAAAFKNLKAAANELITTKKTFNAENGVSFKSPKGVMITLPPNSLLLPSGLPAEGEVVLEYKEIFNRGAMLTNNRPTMGRDADGNKALLISGGEFFLEAKQGSEMLNLNGSVNLLIPTKLTVQDDGGMLLWEGTIDENDNLTWDEVKADAGTNGGRVGVEGKGDGQQFVVSFTSFGWTNVDRFYSDPRPKTTLQVAVPTGYDNKNAAVYLSYDGEGDNALAGLDTYDSVTKRFSEHYGQIPVGLQMHVIFVTEEAGQWRYGIKGVTVAANDVYAFTLAETTLGSLTVVEAAINALP